MKLLCLLPLAVSLPTFDSQTPVGVGDTSDSGIDSILSKYRVSVMPILEMS